MNTKFTTGIIIGRFQTPYLHEGHKHLIDTAVRENTVVLILIGCTKGFVMDERNPYSFDDRFKMITEAYPTVMTTVLEDTNDDLEWSRKVDFILSDCVNPTLYGSRDSFITHYKGSFPYREVTEIPGISATKIRESLKK